MTIGIYDFHRTSFRLLIVIRHEMCTTCNKYETVCFDRWYLMIYDTYELTKIHDLDCGKLFDVELSCFVIK